MTDSPRIEGLVPAALEPASYRIFLQDFDVAVDIGFHDFEVGTPQRVFVSLDIWVSAEHFASQDLAEAAWDYDFLRTEIHRMIGRGRFNLQETFARAIYDLIAARAGVVKLCVRTSKVDIYPDCAAVGVEIASF